MRIQKLGYFPLRDFPTASAGVEFIDENSGGPGVRLRKRQRTKKFK
jgi:hypothetical protein